MDINIQILMNPNISKKQKNQGSLLQNAKVGRFISFFVSKIKGK